MLNRVTAARLNAAASALDGEIPIAPTEAPARPPLRACSIPHFGSDVPALHAGQQPSSLHVGPEVLTIPTASDHGSGAFDQPFRSFDQRFR
jgi:hypothetical protein